MISWQRNKMLFRLVALLAFIFLGSLYFFPADIYQWSPPCFFKEELHLYCTFCGGFRALSYMVCGDLITAWWHNAFIVLLAPFICYQGINSYRNIRQGRSNVLSVSFPGFYYILVLAIIFTVLRNTHFYSAVF